jgi:hypothetical protein
MQEGSEKQRLCLNAEEWESEEAGKMRWEGYQTFFVEAWSQCSSWLLYSQDRNNAELIIGSLHQQPKEI